MSAGFVVQESGTPSRKYHLSSERLGKAFCGAEPQAGVRWNVSGNRADFERHVPARICKRCRSAEAAADQDETG